MLKECFHSSGVGIELVEGMDDLMWFVFLFIAGITLPAILLLLICVLGEAFNIIDCVWFF